MLFGRVVGVVLHHRLLCSTVEFDLAAALARAQPAEGLADGDAGQPGREARGPGELIEMPVGRQIGLLHRVLGVVVVAQDGARGAEQPLVVAPHQDLEERLVAAANPRDHVFIGQGAVVSHLSIGGVYAPEGYVASPPSPRIQTTP